MVMRCGCGSLAAAAGTLPPGRRARGPGCRVANGLVPRPTCARVRARSVAMSDRRLGHPSARARKARLERALKARPERARKARPGPEGPERWAAAGPEKRLRAGLRASPVAFRVISPRPGSPGLGFCNARLLRPNLLVHC